MSPHRDHGRAGWLRFRRERHRNSNIQPSAITSPATRTARPNLHHSNRSSSSFEQARRAGPSGGVATLRKVFPFLALTRKTKNPPGSPAALRASAPRQSTPGLRAAHYSGASGAANHRGAFSRQGQRRPQQPTTGLPFPFGPPLRYAPVRATGWAAPPFVLGQCTEWAKKKLWPTSLRSVHPLAQNLAAVYASLIALNTLRGGQSARGGP